MHYTNIIAKHNQENFPVASLLLPRTSRKNLLDFYAFARGADDIADDPVMLPQQKRKQLEDLREALRQNNREKLPVWARGYLRLVQGGRLSPRHGEDLISAFLQDTHKQRYRDPEELIHYCSRSAAPVGRAMLELGGEEKADINAADSLCNALQLLNHLQDIGKDYLVLNRIYLPLSWMQQAGAGEDLLLARQSSPPLRKVIDRMLEYIDELLRQSQKLPVGIASRRLRLEVRIIGQMARQLHRKLQRQDPLAVRVKLTTGEKISALWQALKQEYF